MAGAAQYEYRGRFTEAWQRVSPTQLRKKIVRTWSRRYVGINGEADAKAKAAKAHAANTATNTENLGNQIDFISSMES